MDVVDSMFRSKPRLASGDDSSNSSMGPTGSQAARENVPFAIWHRWEM